MDNLNKAYLLIENLSPDSSLLEAREVALKAYELSKDCIEASVILVRTGESFSEKEKILLDSIDSLNNSLKINEDDQLKRNIDRAYYELGSLYFSYGMFNQSIKIFKPLVIKDLHYPLIYKLLIGLAITEDDYIEEFYNERIKQVSDIEYVRLTFTYLVYLYKQNRMDEVKTLYKKINELNPMFNKVLKDEIEKEDEEKLETKEVLKVLRNNSILINTCEYLVKELVGLC